MLNRNNLKNRRLFKIAKYNRNLQDKMDINKNNYAKFCEIIVEIIPKTDKYGKFINIINKNNEPFFHIYNIIYT